MKALAHLVWGKGVPDCKRCAADPRLRAKLGCEDEPAPEELYQVSCSACGGSGRDCARCGGSGLTGLRRCPRRLALDGPDAEMAFRLFQHYEEHDVLPAPGGLMDQAVGLFLSFEIIRSEKARIDADRAKDAERERMKQQKLAERASFTHGAAGMGRKR